MIWILTAANVILTIINWKMIRNRQNTPKGEYTENGVQFRNKKGKVVLSSDQAL